MHEGENIIKCSILLLTQTNNIVKIYKLKYTQTMVVINYHQKIMIYNSLKFSQNTNTNDIISNQLHNISIGFIKGRRTLPTPIQQRRCNESSRREHWHNPTNHFPQHIQSVQRALESSHSHAGVKPPKAVQKHQSNSIQRLVITIQRLHTNVI